MVIYEIVCLKNNKKYIGQTKNLYNRRCQHLSLLRKSKHQNSYLQSDFNLFGEDSFVFNKLETICEKGEFVKISDKREKYYILKFKTNNRLFGYNIESGGTVNKKLADETKIKISKSHIGVGVGKDGYWKGKKLPQYVKDKLSSIRKGRPSHWRGKTQTYDHIKKRTDCQFGKVWINNGEKSRFVTKDEADFLVKCGFVYGRPYAKRKKRIVD